MIAAWISTLKLSFTQHPFGRFGIARHYATRGCSRLGGLGAWRSNGQGSRAGHLQSSKAHRPLRYRHPSSVSCVHRRTLSFGWAKPVPVDMRRLRNPRRDMALVAAAGPTTNLALAWASAMAAHLVLLLPHEAAIWAGKIWRNLYR